MCVGCVWSLTRHQTNRPPNKVCMALQLIGFALVLIEEIERLEHLRNTRNEVLLVTPNDGVFDQMLLVLCVATLLQRADAIGAVVLQMGRLGFDGIGRAPAAQTRQREVIVQRQNLLNVVEALDVLIRFRVIIAAVDVLQHVHVARDVGLPPVRMFGIVPKVDVAEIIGCARVIGRGQRFRHDDVNQFVPRLHVLRQDDLVRVHERDVVVTVQIAVQAVVVRDHLVLALARDLRLEVHVT